MLESKNLTATVHSSLSGDQKERVTDNFKDLKEFIGPRWYDACGPAGNPMSLRLAWGAGSEAVDLEASGDADDAGLIFAGGEVAGLLGGSRAGPVGPVADEERRVEDLEQEGGQGQVKILRGESPP